MKKTQRKRRKASYVRYFPLLVVTVVALAIRNVSLLSNSDGGVDDTASGQGDAWQEILPSLTQQFLPSQQQRQEQRKQDRGGDAPTHTACEHTDGIFHIQLADRGGGVGTAFFQLIISQILYAESLNLTPWVHFRPNISDVVEDPRVHTSSTPTILTARVGATIERVRGPHFRHIEPGKIQDQLNSTVQQLSFHGTGIWESYFDPISDFRPGDRSCADKLYVTLNLDDLYLVIPGLHSYHPAFAVRCWRYTHLPDYVSQPHQSLYTWLAPQRARAARTVRERYRFRVPPASPSTAACHRTTNPCLGLHIRHSDKAAGRRVVAVTEFLPYARAFLDHGGRHIYLATDSVTVLSELRASWPSYVVDALWVANGVDRSSDTTPVFDMVQHDDSNRQILGEIQSLAECQFLVHGHSAVSEAAIWTNEALHNTSVNLEDDDRLDSATFGSLVQMVLTGVSSDSWPRPVCLQDAWPPSRWSSKNSIKSAVSTMQPSHEACHGYDGVLRISSVGHSTTAGAAFFSSVLNQLLFAAQHNLLPWVHLYSDNKTVVYDDTEHSSAVLRSFQMINGMAVSVAQHDDIPNSVYPRQPAQRDKALTQHTFTVDGTGVWNTYFEPVSHFVPGDESCRDTPLIEMEEILVSPGLTFAPWSIKTWRYDNIPGVLVGNQTSLTHWLAPMRSIAHEMVQKYVRFKPWIAERANTVNPDIIPETPCLGIHIRVSDKIGKYRRKVKAGDYKAYMEAYAKAGGKVIYVATDSQRPLMYMSKNFPNHVVAMIRTQGNHTIRSVTGSWPTHIMDSHHRVNSEALVDILALSKCSFMLHSHSTVSEAAMYLNPALTNSSINLEDPEKMSAGNFEMLVRFNTGVDSVLQVAPADDEPIVAQLPERSFREPTVLTDSKSDRACRTNAIVYLAQKVHSSYGRDSYGSLLQSLDLLRKNYLSVGHHLNNTDIFIFHTGDFNGTDLVALEARLNTPQSIYSSRGIVRLVDLSESTFWARPQYNLNDNPSDWYAYPLFSEGYRRMMHWFAIDIWNFFEYWNQESRCNYRYIFRLDEDSFIHSKISYDIFERMKSRSFVYGFRMCAYEMKVTQRMSTLWMKRHASFVPERDIDLDMCGFYNNFFVADLRFFLSPNVTNFLTYIDRQGHIYRRRLGDLMIHSMAVYWFAKKEQIHRFLDFTYEHSTLNQISLCVQWGGIQAGYDDENALENLERFNKTMVVDRKCQVNSSAMKEEDLSPTYAHLPNRVKDNFSLQTITAGNVELPDGKGILSG